MQEFARREDYSYFTGSEQGKWQGTIPDENGTLAFI